MAVPSPAHPPAQGAAIPILGLPKTQRWGASSPSPDTAFMTLPTKELPVWCGVRHAGVQARRGVQALLLGGVSSSSSFRGEGGYSTRVQLVTAPASPGSQSHARESHKCVTHPGPSCRPCPQHRAPTCSSRAALRQSASSSNRTLFFVMPVEQQEILDLFICKLKSSALVLSSSLLRAACSSLWDGISLSRSSISLPRCGMRTWLPLTMNQQYCKSYRFRQLPSRWDLLAFPQPLPPTWTTTLGWSSIGHGQNVPSDTPGRA